MHTSIFLQACLVAVTVGRIIPRGQVIGRDVALNSSYDFIIIGGGTSGLTVANRLTENPQSNDHYSSPTPIGAKLTPFLGKASVLVIEDGPLDDGENSVLVPGLLNLTSSPYFYNLTSTPQAGLANNSFPVNIANVVGGGTVVNGMFFARASASDYDSWTELGAEGWGWKDLLPYFLKVFNSSLSKYI